MNMLLLMLIVAFLLLALGLRYLSHKLAGDLRSWIGNAGFLLVMLSIAVIIYADILIRQIMVVRRYYRFDTGDHFSFKEWVNPHALLTVGSAVFF